MHTRISVECSVLGDAVGTHHLMELAVEAEGSTGFVVTLAPLAAGPASAGAGKALARFPLRAEQVWCCTPQRCRQWQGSRVTPERGSAACLTRSCLQLVKGSLP